jgi:hypothetical protein
MPLASRETYRQGTHTRVAAAFYTDEANGLHIPEPVQSHGSLGTILSYDYQKSMGGAAGTWSLTIKKPKRMGARSALRDLWRDPEDVWVRIKVIVDGQPIERVLGMIDTVKEDTARAGSGAR